MNTVISFKQIISMKTTATFTFTGNSSILTSHFYPELQFDRSHSYSCALLELTTYNSIPNITNANNKLYFKSEKSIKVSSMITKLSETENIYYIAIPTGSYEFTHIISHINNAFKEANISFTISVDTKTLKSSIKTTVELLFDRIDSIHRKFGFNDQIIKASKSLGQLRTSENTVSITSLNTIAVECDICVGSYNNGEPGHSIYEFPINVEYGYKIVEVPKHIVYLPINRYSIPSIQIRIVDQDGQLIDLRGEKFTCRIHIKRD